MRCAALRCFAMSELLTYLDSFATVEIAFAKMNSLEQLQQSQ